MAMGKPRSKGSAHKFDPKMIEFRVHYVTNVNIYK
jgi:hypothetical protein